MYDEAKNQVLKAKVIERAGNPKFKHHQWFVTFHLEIVEQISGELCEIYPEADSLQVQALVWLHDYEKIIDFDNQYNTELLATRELMREVGYPPATIEAMAAQLNFYNAKQQLATAPIETQIVSSADGASHLIAPFFPFYWHEHPGESVALLQAENRRKAAVDWDRKITLPEVKKSFAARREWFMELSGQLPERYLLPGVGKKAA